jgi:iron complex outermembrane receptor protein
MDADKKQSGFNPGESSEMDIDKDEVALTYNKKLQSNLDLSVSTFYQRTVLEPYEKTISVSKVSTATTEQDSKFKDEKWGVKPKLKLSYGEGNSAGSSIVFGLDYIKNKMLRDVDVKVNVVMATMPKPINQTAFTLNKLEKETISGFIHNTYKYNKFEFIQGFRYERANYDIKRSSPSMHISGTKDTNNFALELAANYLYSDTGNTYIKYERGFTSPPPALMTNKENGQYYMNNLKSETYDTFEWGVKDFVLDSYVRATAFYTITRDEITTDTIGSYSSSSGTIYNYNLDKTKRFGVELSAEQYLGKFTLSESYSFIKTRICGTRRNGDDYTGNEIANVPQNRFKIGGKYAYNKNFSAGFETIYAGSYYLNNANLGGKQNEHVVTNIVANYDFNNGLRVFAGINNLFNERYYDEVSYSTSTGIYTYDPAVGRNYYVGFNYNF